MMYFRSEKGLTLIELIVSIAIVALMFAAVVATLNPFDQLRKAHDAKRKSDLAQIQRVLEATYQDNGGKYPSNDSAYHIIDFKTATPLPWGSTWEPYITALPSDPNGKNYVYYSPNGQTYYLYASLERGTQDPGSCNRGAACSTATGIGSAPGPNACAGTCNYGVTSANVSP